MSIKKIIKSLLWVSSSKKDLMTMPEAVITDFGYGLYQAQTGKHPDIAKTLSGFGSASIIELVQDHKGDTFRAVYTVKFSDAIIVLHAFQKKSKKSIETPKQDMELIRSRLKLAEEIYKDWKRKGDKNNG
ncbi:MAG: type II toxin-antitoxin system RelE/ParE family toxin [Candidatus Rhabdochlamydia sp.]